MSTYIEVSAEVRYWDDAVINGVSTESGETVPFKQGELWCPVIRLSDGMVMDWPQGTTADIHFKVCDQGQYWLLDAERNRSAKWKSDYVPDDFLCPTESGFADYIILRIGADGMIDGWKQPVVNHDEWELQAAPAGEREAVAWAHYAKVGGNWFMQWPTYHREKDAIDAIAEYGKGETVVVRPLYTTPPPAPAVEALVEALSAMVEMAESPDFDGAPSDAVLAMAKTALSAYLEGGK